MEEVWEMLNNLEESEIIEEDYSRERIKALCVEYKELLELLADK